MKKKFKISIPIRKQILFYLSNYINFKESFEVDNAITQQGIAGAIGIRIEYVSRAVKRLKNDGYLSVRSAHIRGINRKKKAYFLTEKGIEQFKDIKKWFNNKLVLIRTLEGELLESNFFQLEKLLNYKLKPLGAFKYASTSKNGIIDLERIISDIKQIDPTFSIKQNYKQIISCTIKKDFILSPNVPKIENFFGRVKELDQLKTWIDNERSYHSIIVYGMPGIGKSTLISKLIEDYKDKKHIFWHKLDKWDSSKVIIKEILDFLSTINDEYLKFYIDLKKPINLKEIIEVLSERLNKLDTIFIFDDFHKADDEITNFISAFSKIIEGTINGKLIVVTRYNIPFYEQKEVLVNKLIAELELKGLDFESGKQLLQNKNLPKNMIKELYKRTFGNPLLLEIIEYQNKIDKYLSDEIFSELSAEERSLMEILSVYEKPIPIDALFANENILSETIDNLIRRLIIKESKDGLYYTHEFIKDYFYQRLNPYTKYKYHNFCGEFYLNQKTLMDNLEALYHFIKAHKYEKAIDLAQKKAQNIIDEGLSEKFLTILEEIPEEKVLLSQWANILMLKAKLCFITGNWDISLQYYHRAIEVGTELGKENIKAQAYCEIGHISEEQNLFDIALENFQKSLEISKKVNDNKKLAEAKRGIGRYYWRKSDYKSAEKYLKDSLKALKNIDDFKLIGAIHIDLGTIYYEQFKSSQAAKYYEESLKILKKVGDKTESIRAYNNLGTACLYDGKYESAINYYEQQLKLAEALGDIRAIGYGLGNAGYCYAKLDQIKNAEIYSKRAMEISDMLDNENILYPILKTHGLINKYYGKWDEAINNFNKSLAIIKKLNDSFYIFETLIELGLLYKDKGDFDNAKKCYRKAYSMCKEMDWSIPNHLKEKLLELSKI